MESGGQSGMPIGPTTTMGQPAYDDLAAATNCTNDPKGSLQCLKGISAEQMLDAQAATLAQYPGGYVTLPPCSRSPASVTDIVIIATHIVRRVLDEWAGNS